jgi:regulator of protease activity HflC (stomatin/prohibitin superfamily)
LEEFISIY